MSRKRNAHVAGQAAPACGTKTVPAPWQGHSAGALRTIEGESRAAEFLTRLHAQQADPDELALIVAALYGAVLRGFCAAITKALRGGVA